MTFAKDNHYSIVFGSWIASMAGAFTIVGRSPYLTTQQKLVQARVYAQGLTMAVVIASLAFEGVDSAQGKGRWETVKYIDPSYTIRSAPANARDSAFCLMLGHHAVHSALSGRTAMVLGNWKNEFTHVPIAAVSERKQIDPEGRLWSSVVGSTGQPRAMR